jgi:hypothetical protein
VNSSFLLIPQELVQRKSREKFCIESQVDAAATNSHLSTSECIQTKLDHPKPKLTLDKVKVIIYDLLNLKKII